MLKCLHQWLLKLLSIVLTLMSPPVSFFVCLFFFFVSFFLLSINVTSQQKTMTSSFTFLQYRANVNLILKLAPSFSRGRKISVLTKQNRIVLRVRLQWTGFTRKRKKLSDLWRRARILMWSWHGLLTAGLNNFKVTNVNNDGWNWDLAESANEKVDASQIYSENIVSKPLNGSPAHDVFHTDLNLASDPTDVGPTTRLSCARCHANCNAQ